VRFGPAAALAAGCSAGSGAGGRILDSGADVRPVARLAAENREAFAGLGRQPRHRPYAFQAKAALGRQRSPRPEPDLLLPEARPLTASPAAQARPLTASPAGSVSDGRSIHTCCTYQRVGCERCCILMAGPAHGHAARRRDKWRKGGWLPLGVRACRSTGVEAEPFEYSSKVLPEGIEGTYQQYKAPSGTTMAYWRRRTWLDADKDGLPSNEPPEGIPSLFGHPMHERALLQPPETLVSSPYIKSQAYGRNELAGPLLLLGQQITADIYRGALGGMAKMEIPQNAAELATFHSDNSDDIKSAGDAVLKLWDRSDGQPGLFPFTERPKRFTPEQILAACFAPLPLVSTCYDAYAGQLTDHFRDADRRFLFLSLALPHSKVLLSHPASSVAFTPNPFAPLLDDWDSTLAKQARLVAEAILHGPVRRIGVGDWEELPGLKELEGMNFPGSRSLIGGDSGSSPVIPQLDGIKSGLVQIDGKPYILSKVATRLMSLSLTMLDKIVLRFRQQMPKCNPSSETRFPSIASEADKSSRAVRPHRKRKRSSLKQQVERLKQQQHGAKTTLRNTLRAKGNTATLRAFATHLKIAASITTKEDLVHAVCGAVFACSDASDASAGSE